MIKVVTNKGVELNIDETVCDDIYYLEALAAAEDDVVNYIKALTMLLGKEQKTLLYKSLEDVNGRVPIASVNEAFTEIMTKAGEEIKNSSSSPA